MIAEISLNNVRIYSNHGCLQEEKIIGSEYRVDLKVKTDITQATQTDNLIDAVDYVSLQKLIEEEVMNRHRLLETVINNLSNRILKEHRSIIEVDLKLAKLNPPINGEVESVALRIIQHR